LAKAEVRYNFFDDKLYQYYISIAIYTLDRIKNEILDALNEKYGKQAEIKEKSQYSISEYRWNSKNQKVGYWISKNDEKNKFHIGIRVEHLT